MAAETMLKVAHVSKVFPVGGRGRLEAVTDVSFTLAEGTALALVGESGCGKSTLARMIVRLLDVTSGSIEYRGSELTTASPGRLRALRRELQMVFQDPNSSLNPRWRVRDIVGEPLRAHGYGGDHRRRVDELLDLVGLGPGLASRRPRDLSGGQRQRVGIARAIALEPRVLILDEPVSALDVSVQSQVVNLLTDLRRRLNLAYLFISHDLALVRYLADEVLVMHLGRIVERGSNDEVLTRPMHPYTHALLSAAPYPDPRIEAVRRRIVLTGELPSPLDPPSGCRFKTRCWRARELCDDREPELTAGTGTHSAACHFPAEPPAGSPARTTPHAGG